MFCRAVHPCAERHLFHLSVGRVIFDPVLITSKTIPSVEDWRILVGSSCQRAPEMGDQVRQEVGGHMIEAIWGRMIGTVLGLLSVIPAKSSYQIPTLDSIHSNAINWFQFLSKRT